MLQKSVSFAEVIADNYLEPSANSENIQEVGAQMPLHLHCVNMNLSGFDELSSDYLSTIKTLADNLKPRVVSDHLCVQSHAGIYTHDLLPFAWNQKSLGRVSKRVDKVQQT